MAPLPILMANEMLQISPRSIGSVPSDGSQGQELSASQGYISQCLSLAFASTSVVSAILAFYWFVRMRRSFRHDLIMLLIQSDMFKALWFMIFPIVVFIHGPVSSDSNFCQISGFLLSVGIEASDTAIFMIAVHTALYIFKPRSSAGEGGLYPYRRISYMIWIIFPLLTASLAFLNEHKAYVNQGTYCYLPVRPFWYQLALSWIPRYIIIITILVVYISIYFYVRHKFHGFENNHSQNSRGSNGTERQRKHQKRSSVASAPTLASHGLITEPRRPSGFFTEGRKLSTSTIVSLANIRTNAHRFMWTSVLQTRTKAQSASPPSEFSAPDTDSVAGTSTPQPVSESTGSTSPGIAKPLPTLNPMVVSRNSTLQNNLPRRLSLDSNNSGSTPPSSTDIFTVLQAPPPNPSPTNIPPLIPDIQLSTFPQAHDNCLDVSEMIRTREKIRRQLRFLFIYPLVYITMWILPFISHVLLFDDKLAASPPFALTCITNICICSQGAVDCWLFSTREKPWKHIPGEEGGFLQSLKFWSVLKLGWSEGENWKTKKGPGKTRNEMAREAREAYRRRDEELADRRVRGNSFTMCGGQGVVERRDRSWWDVSVSGLDASAGMGMMMGMGVVAMTPVAEEVGNPMDEATLWEEEGEESPGTKEKEKEQFPKMNDVSMGTKVESPGMDEEFPRTDGQPSITNDESLDAAKQHPIEMNEVHGDVNEEAGGSGSGSGSGSGNAGTSAL